MGEDFEGVEAMEFFLKPGDAPVCLNITLMDDDVIEGREFFLVALKDLRWGEIIDSIVININDDDGTVEPVYNGHWISRSPTLQQPGPAKWPSVYISTCASRSPLYNSHLLWARG